MELISIACHLENPCNTLDDECNERRGTISFRTNLYYETEAGLIRVHNPLK